MIYKDNNKDVTTGSKLINIYPVTITQRGASERYVPSREKGRGVKLGKTLILVQYQLFVQYQVHFFLMLSRDSNQRHLDFDLRFRTNKYGRSF